MSFQKDNYVEETHPLFRLLQVEAFRLVIVRYNHYSLVTQLKADLQATFPERPFAEIDAETTDYRTLVDTYYQTGSGFFYIQNFRALLNNPELYAGLNQRRDKLAQYPIAIIAFVEPPTTDQFAVQIMEKMPDLWSFRSLLLDLYKPIEITNSNSFEIPELSIPYISTIGGSTVVGKEKALAELLNTIANTPETEIDYLFTQYQHVGQLQMDLGKYQDAIITYDKLISITNNNSYKAALLLSEGDAYKMIGQVDIAILKYEVSKKLCYEDVEDNMLVLLHVIEELGHACTLTVAFDKAFGYYNEQLSTLQHYLESYPDDLLKYDISWSYSLLGDAQVNLKNYNHALIFYKKCYDLAEKYGNKTMLAVSFRKLGVIHEKLGNVLLALRYFEKNYIFSSEFFEANPDFRYNKKSLAISLKHLGQIEVKLGNISKAISHYQKFLMLINELRTDFPMNTDFAYSFGNSCLHIGNFYETIQQDRSTAVEYYKMALTTYDWILERTKIYKLYENYYYWVVNKLQTLNQ